MSPAAHLPRTFLFVLGTVAGASPAPPRDALARFRVEAGLRVELAASEPQVADPVSLCWDEDGVLYVSEMRDYPYGYRPDEPPLSRVRRLEDRDGDGHYEHSTIFADRLHWATSVAPWKGGVFVIAPPEILYLKDLTGDGVADERRAVFTGVGTKSAEDVMNGLAWGPDHQLYGIPSYSGGEIATAALPGAPPLAVGGHDFRIDPMRGTMELIEGGEADFGQCFDDWGRRFTTHMNTVALHPWLPLRHAARQPDLTGVRATRDIGRLGDDNAVFQISPPEAWRLERKQGWQDFVNTSHDLRAERFGGTELEPRGFVTSAAGVAVFRGTALPDAYRGDLFTGEPACNAVIRTRLERDGASFVARRPAGSRAEFLASTDNWFRPVNLANGPDGALYIADMYREVIEDPSAIPAAILQRLDLRNGNDFGRIWRITGDATPREPGPPRLSKATTTELVAELENRNGWRRETAHRLIFERQDKTAVGPLRMLLRESDLPQARLHALWSLGGLDALDEAALLTAAKDGHPAVRRAALQLSAPWLERSLPLLAALEQACGDGDPEVRLEAALSAGELSADRRLPLLKKSAGHAGGDPLLLSALLTSTRGVELRLATSLLSPATDATLLGGLAKLIGTRGEEAEIAAFIAALNGQRDRLPATLIALSASGLAEGLELSGRSSGELRALIPELAGASETRTQPVAAAAADEPGMEAWRESLDLQGDASRGKDVFSARCAACHLPQGGKPAIGPAMQTVRGHGAEQVLQSIVEPGREVSPNFFMQSIETRNGETVIGMVASQDAASLTLRLPGGTERTLLKRNIAKQTESRASLMPPGLLTGCTQQQVADLLAFILSSP